MPLKNLQKLAVIALFFVTVIPSAQAAVGSSANYTLDTAVISGSGGSGSSASYNLPKFVMGGDVEGSASSASYKLCSEFEYATDSGCVGAALVTPPTPPTPPPVIPPVSSGGGGSGSGYIPPQVLIIPPPVKPPVTPVKPPVKPPVTPSGLPAVTPGTPPATQPAQGEQQQPSTGQPAAVKQSQLATINPAAPGGEGETRPIAILPVIPGMGETGYKEITEIPFFRLPASKDNVWCGKTSCAGIPLKLLKPSAPVTHKLVSTSWQGWFMLSLVITGILFWVEWKINAEKPLPAAAKRKKRKK